MDEKQEGISAADAEEIRRQEAEMMCRKRDEAHAASQAANATYEDDIAREARAAAAESAARLAKG